MSNHTAGTMEHRPVELRRIQGLAWGLFFIWIGIVLLASISWGVGLLGIGILIFAGQLTRKQMGHELEAFWLVVGTFFVLGGIWMLLGIQVSLIPICSILAGAVLLVTALFGKVRPSS